MPVQLDGQCDLREPEGECQDSFGPSGADEEPRRVHEEVKLYCFVGTAGLQTPHLLPRNVVSTGI